MSTSISTTMTKPTSTMAQQLAEAVIAFEERVTGHVPKSATVIRRDSTLEITVHSALSAAERAVAKTPVGASRIRQFHSELFANSFHSLRDEIKRISGVEIREATAEVDTTTGSVVMSLSSVITSGANPGSLKLQRR